MPSQLDDRETHERDTVDLTKEVSPVPAADPESEPSGSTALPVAESTAAAPAADAPSDVEAPAAAAPSRARRALGWVRRHLLALLAALLVVALVVALVLTTLSVRRNAALEDARESALQAGKDSAVALATYDYRTLDRDFGAVTDRSTPGFRDSFTQSSAALRQVLQQYNATATSTVVAAGLTSATEDRAVVLVFLNQVATNTNQQAGPTTDQSRVEVTLVRPDDRWLIDAVKLL